MKTIELHNGIKVLVGVNAGSAGRSYVARVVGPLGIVGTSRECLKRAVAVTDAKAEAFKRLNEQAAIAGVVFGK